VREITKNQSNKKKRTFKQIEKDEHAFETNEQRIDRSPGTSADPHHTRRRLNPVIDKREDKRKQEDRRIQQFAANLKN
jgi:hypothetical protein